MLRMLGGIHGKVLARSSVPVFIPATPESLIMGKIYNNIVEIVGGTARATQQSHRGRRCHRTAEMRIF